MAAMHKISCMLKFCLMISLALASRISPGHSRLWRLPGLSNAFPWFQCLCMMLTLRDSGPRGFVFSLLSHTSSNIQGGEIKRKHLSISHKGRPDFFLFQNSRIILMKQEIIQDVMLVDVTEIIEKILRYMNIYIGHALVYPHSVPLLSPFALDFKKITDTTTNQVDCWHA